jgi:hypothetical protein
MGIISTKAVPDEYKRRFSLSSLWEVLDAEEAPVSDGMTFLKKMLELTKTRADPKAQRRPIAFDAETSNEQASITPNVSGRSEM